tara:strand:+ start:375 stop:560 length:186 start_codon:yes stop_codon:yes gene_type:complete
MNLKEFPIRVCVFEDVNLLHETIVHDEDQLSETLREIYEEYGDGRPFTKWKPFELKLLEVK